MSGKIFLANVGVNASHHIKSPLFDDGTFELICIPERYSGKHILKYKDLDSYNQPHEKLTKYIPSKYHGIFVHDDPEFRSFTYGDVCSENPRASGLREIQEGDFLFFIARLVRWHNGSYTQDAGFYLVGYFKIENVFWPIKSKSPINVLNRIKENAHVRRGLTDNRLFNGFWVFVGSKENSGRFRYAVPVTKKFATMVFRSKAGKLWKWSLKQTELQVIGSYTRTCRCILNPDKSSDTERLRIFWDYIHKHQK